MSDRLSEQHDGIGVVTLNRPERALKRLDRHGLTEDFAAHSHHVLMELMLLVRSQDFQEGLAAFMEHRPPRYAGR